MKILGKTSTGYITEVSRVELKKFFNTYYNSMNDKALEYNLEDLNVGKEVDLGKGHDFFQDTKNALKETQSFLKANKKVIATIIEGINVMKLESELEDITDEG